MKSTFLLAFQEHFLLAEKLYRLIPHHLHAYSVYQMINLTVNH